MPTPSTEKKSTTKTSKIGKWQNFNFHGCRFLFAFSDIHTVYIGFPGPYEQTSDEPQVYLSAMLVVAPRFPPPTIFFFNSHTLYIGIQAHSESWRPSPDFLFCWWDRTRPLKIIVLTLKISVDKNQEFPSIVLFTVSSPHNFLLNFFKIFFDRLKGTLSE